MRSPVRAASLLALSAAAALALAPAALADHSITVQSSPAGATKVARGMYRVSFTTTATSTHPCRNWADAADAWAQGPRGGRDQLSPVERSSTASPDNANEATVTFTTSYRAPAGSTVTFSSRVVCDLPMHIGGEGIGSPVTLDVPADEDDECGGEGNRITSVRTPSGDDLGLVGTQLVLGQRIVATERTTIRLGDGASLMISEGDSFRVTDCGDEDTFIDVVSDALTRLLSGDGSKFRVQTPRAVTGTRGTEFTVRYDARRQRTTVKVLSGKVFVRARRGSERVVMAGRGETVVQVRRRAPRVL